MELAIFICVLANLVVSLFVLFELRFKRRKQFAQLTDAVEATAASAANAVNAVNAASVAEMSRAPDAFSERQQETRGTDAVAEVCTQLAGEFALTPREGEVLFHLARGYNCRSIAERMTISESTVKSHSLKIYRKLGVHSQQDVITLVHESMPPGHTPGA